MKRARRGRVIDHARDGLPGLLRVSGVKYTTARLVAERGGRLALSRRGRKAAARRTATRPLPGATTGASEAGLAARARHAVREELALRLEDVLLRRLGLTAEGHLGEREILAAARTSSVPPT